jgi:hypothetical protein
MFYHIQMDLIRHKLRHLPTPDQFVLMPNPHHFWIVSITVAQAF